MGAARGVDRVAGENTALFAASQSGEKALTANKDKRSKPPSSPSPPGYESVYTTK